MVNKGEERRAESIGTLEADVHDHIHGPENVVALFRSAASPLIDVVRGGRRLLFIVVYCVIPDVTPEGVCVENKHQPSTPRVCVWNTPVSLRAAASCLAPFTPWWRINIRTDVMLS